MGENGGLVFGVVLEERCGQNKLNVECEGKGRDKDLLQE